MIGYMNHLYISLVSWSDMIQVMLSLRVVYGMCLFSNYGTWRLKSPYHGFGRICARESNMEVQFVNEIHLNVHFNMLVTDG